MALRIKHSPVPISAVGNVTVLTGLDYQSTNSFEDPHNVSFEPPPCIPAIPINCLMSLYMHASCPCWTSKQDLKHGEVYSISTQAHDVAQSPLTAGHLLSCHHLMQHALLCKSQKSMRQGSGMYAGIPKDSQIQGHVV